MRPGVGPAMGRSTVRIGGWPVSEIAELTPGCPWCGGRAIVELGEDGWPDEIRCNSPDPDCNWWALA